MIRRLSISFISLFIIVLSTQSLIAQKHEAGFLIGGSNYFGDINTNYGFRYSRPAGTIFYRYNLSKYVSFRASGSYGRVGGSDEFVDKPYQQVRNLSFNSNIFESTIQSEFNFFKYEVENVHHFYSPYLATGITLFHFKPMATLDGQDFELQNLGTEGQAAPDISGKDKYPLWNIAIPVSMGLKWWVANRLSFNAEVGYRLTFTDYIDDVSNTFVDDFVLGDAAAELADRSDEVLPVPIGIENKQRGFAQNNDHYFFGQIGLSWTFRQVTCNFVRDGHSSGRLR